MELTNEFRVPVPVERAWDVLTDVERIAPCMPGAQLTEIGEDGYHGIVKVKVGPITAQYQGTATFVEQDRDAWRVVLKAQGRDTRGQGNASALVTATLVAQGPETAVKVETDITITGKVAQFGRGVLADVSARLIDQFAESLRRDVLSAVDGSTTADTSPGADIAAVAGTSPAAGTTRVIDAPEPEPVDLLGTAGAPLAKRLIPLVVVSVILLIWRRRVSSRRAHRETARAAQG